MRVAVLHNHDHELLEDDPGRAARADVVCVAAAMKESLERAKHEVLLVPVEQDLLGLQATLGAKRPDVVLNLCESLAGDSRGEMLTPGLLELLGLPYTGSSAASLALALHKHEAKAVLRARGVPTPEFCVVSRVEELRELRIGFPLIVKPSREDASVGIEFDSVVTTRPDLERAVSRVLSTFEQPALVERFIEGREIYVPLLGNSPRRVLPLTEIRFGKAFDGLPRIVSYAAKWNTDSAVCIDSPGELTELPRELEARCVAVATAAFEALECRDYGRVDLRVDERGQPWVIDINPNCDLHPQAGFARAAAAVGLSHADLAAHLVDLAWERHANQAPRSARPTALVRATRAHRDLHARRGGVRPRAHRRRAHAEPP